MSERERNAEIAVDMISFYVYRKVLFPEQKAVLRKKIQTLNRKDFINFSDKYFLTLEKPVPQ